MSIKKESFLLHVSTQKLNVADTADFSIDYTKLYLNPQKEYHLALTSYQMWNSIYNIDSTNNRLLYDSVTAAPPPTYLNVGSYSIEDLNLEIKRVVSLNGDNPDNITIVPNYQNYKVELTLKGGYSITQFASSFWNILGFPNGGYADQTGVSTTISSPQKVDITNGVDSLLINCSLVDSKYNLNNDEHGQSLYNVIIDAPRGGILQKNITAPIYQHISQQGSIHSVRFYITDQSLNKIDLHGEHVNLTIHIEEV